jgi:hypothetical protein
MAYGPGVEFIGACWRRIVLDADFDDTAAKDCIETRELDRRDLSLSISHPRFKTQGDQTHSAPFSYSTQRRGRLGSQMGLRPS